MAMRGSALSGQPLYPEKYLCRGCLQQHVQCVAVFWAVCRHHFGMCNINCVCNCSCLQDEQPYFRDKPQWEQAAFFSWNAVPEGSGTLCVGDAVQVLQRRERATADSR